MGNRAASLSYEVALTPHHPDEDVDRIVGYLSDPSQGFSWVAVEDDGTIAVKLHAANIDDAERRVRSSLDDADRVRLDVGHPPL